jgi:hypothetical protein
VRKKPVRWSASVLHGLKQFCLSVLIPAIVSAGMSGYISYNNSEKLDQRKENVALINELRINLSQIHLKIISDVGVFTRSCLNGEPLHTEEILKSITTAQVELHDLRRRLEPETKKINAYADGIGELGKTIRSVNKISDLKPVYDSVKRVLAAHDEVSAQLDKELQKYSPPQ